MTTYEHDPNGNPEQYVAERQQWLGEAAQILYGTEMAGVDLAETFTSAGEVRDEAEEIMLPPEREAQLREVAGRFGIGGETDIPAAADVEIIEGGKPWKMEAEARIARPGGIRVYAGSPFRTVGDDEKAYMQSRLEPQEAAGTTEYDVARQLAELESGFEPLEHDQVVDFGYKVEEGNPSVAEPTGQLLQIGTLDGQPVYLLRVDRQPYTDEVTGRGKYRFQPDSAALLRVVTEAMVQSGYEVTSTGLLTSNTYASRSVDAVRAGVLDGHDFRVGMYGRQTLAEVRGEPVASAPSLHQIPGELRTIAKKLALLQAVLPPKV
jgi:hypothetical protein